MATLQTDELDFHCRNDPETQSDTYSCDEFVAGADGQTMAVNVAPMQRDLRHRKDQDGARPYSTLAVAAGTGHASR